MSAPASIDLFAPVLRSPELVNRHDKEGWLALFTPDGTIEDPVGAGVYQGRERQSAFWDAFIAPNRVTFLPRREHASGDTVIRYVTISSVTPVGDEPFALPAIVEYRVRGERIASLRAFWEPSRAVSWHAGQGARGLFGLTKHGLRMTGGLGLGSALAFSRALKPSVSKREGTALAERLARAAGSRSEWLELTRGADVRVSSPSGELLDAEHAFDEALKDAPSLTPEEVIVAGDHLACVLAAGETSAAVLARVAKGRIAALRWVWSVDPHP